MTDQKPSSPHAATQNRESSASDYEDELVLRSLETRDPQATEPLTDVEREAREIAGLLIHQVAETAPPPELKGRVLAHVQSSTAASNPSAVPLAMPAVTPTDAVEDPPVALDDVRSSAARGSVVDRRAVFGGRLAPLALAAAALFALGMAGWAGFVSAELRKEQQTIAQLRSQLVGEAALAADRVPQNMASLQAGFEMVAAPGTKLCKLDSRDPNQPDAEASMLLQPNEGRWVLDARNLKRCPLGRVYQVWFLTDEGPVRGGAFQIRDSAPIVLGSDDLPPGTRAVMVTLENAAEVGSEPSGPTILFGDESRELL